MQLFLSIKTILKYFKCENEMYGILIEYMKPPNADSMQLSCSAKDLLQHWYYLPP